MRRLRSITEYQGFVRASEKLGLYQGNKQMSYKEWLSSMSTDPDYDGFVNTDADIWDLPRTMDIYYQQIKDSEKAKELWWAQGKRDEAATKERIIELRRSIRSITGQ